MNTQSIVIDPRSGVDPADIPDGAYVPLSAAHLVVGKSRATIYRWVDEDRIAVHERQVLGKAVKQYVRVGDLRELEARMHLLGLSAKRRAKVIEARETMR